MFHASPSLEPAQALIAGGPDRDCPLCPRLAAFRAEARAAEPQWFNAPVPSFGGNNTKLLIVGLAPGLRGANRTGRPFTGDYAGDLLYATLMKFGFASGTYDRRPDDGVTLAGATITNAVRCVPPQNKPLPEEIKTCRRFLDATIASLPTIETIIALGRIAHDSVIRACGGKLSSHPFAHGARHILNGPHGPLALFDSYHCSRYNTNTGVLTTVMFEAVFAKAREQIELSAPQRAGDD